MSWRDAPLYVRCHDLAVDLLSRVERAAPAWPALRAALAGDALVLLREVSVALSFPTARAAALERADQAVVALKVNLRLAAQLGLLSEAEGARLGEALVVIGRMLGGWRRRKAGPPRPHHPSGAEPEVPPGA